PDQHPPLLIAEGQVDLSAVGHCRKSLAHLGLTPLLFGEGLRSRDLGELSVAVFAGNVIWILGVGEQVEVPERAGRCVAGLRDEGDIARLRQAWLMAIMVPNRIDFMEWDEHIAVAERGSAQVVSRIGMQLPAARQAALEGGGIPL